MTKDGNAGMLELEHLNNDNESDRWHGLIPWLRMCHYILEEDVLRTCKDAHKWEDREGIDGRNSVSRRKKLF